MLEILIYAKTIVNRKVIGEWFLRIEEGNEELFLKAFRINFDGDIEWTFMKKIKKTLRKLKNELQKSF